MVKTPAPDPYQFDATGKISGGKLEGLSLDLEPIIAQAKAAFDTSYDTSLPWNRMFKPEFQQPYAKGGGFKGLKFGNDGNLYAEVGLEKVPSIYDEAGNYKPEYLTLDGQVTQPATSQMIKVNGWQYDTSTLQQSPYYRKYDPNSRRLDDQQLKYFDVELQGEDLLAVKQGDYTAGWARIKRQAGLMPDVAGRNRNVLGSDPRAAKSGPDTRMATPGKK